MEKSAQKLILVVSLWLKNENFADFEDYERRAARVLERHGGRIERAVRVKKRSNESGAPFEIHVVSFPNEQKFADYQADFEARKLAEQRDRIIARTEIFFGSDMNFYHESKPEL